MKDQLAKAVAEVLAHDGETFVRLVRIAGLDPARDFRSTSLAGLSFEGQDLRRFDFTGSNLSGCNWDGALISTTNLAHSVFDPAAIRRAADWSARGDLQHANSADVQLVGEDSRPFDLDAARNSLSSRVISLQEWDAEHIYAQMRVLFSDLNLIERLFAYRRIFKSVHHLRNDSLHALVEGESIKRTFRLYPHYKLLRSFSDDQLVRLLEEPKSRMHGLTIYSILYRRGRLPKNRDLGVLVATLLDPGIDVPPPDSDNLVISSPQLPPDLYEWERDLVWASLKSRRPADEFELSDLVVRAPSREAALDEVVRQVRSGLRLSMHAVLGLAIQYFPDQSKAIATRTAPPEIRRSELGSTEMGELLRMIALNASADRMPTASDVAIVERLIRRRSGDDA